MIRKSGNLFFEKIMPKQRNEIIIRLHPMDHDLGACGRAHRATLKGHLQENFRCRLTLMSSSIAAEYGAS
jgi:hypothetical protein